MFSHKPENFEASEAKRYGKNNRSKTVEYKYEAYDVAVIGAGHAGCEAALACARL